LYNLIISHIFHDYFAQFTRFHSIFLNVLVK